jgi:aspartyl-tRNA(Asn)/glutamyl-tRNA(Gln) amidotransferase subunit A
VPWSLFEAEADPKVLRTFEDFLKDLHGAGAEVLDVEIRWYREAGEIWRTIRGAEAAAVHRKWLNTAPQLYSEEVRQNLAWGLEVSAVDYITALKDREKIGEKARSLLTSLDAVATPTVPIEAPRISEVESMSIEERSMLRTRMVSLTLQANVAGLPALSLPAGHGANGAPVGAQLVGPPGSDYALLALGWELERSGGGFRYPAPIYP